MMPIMGLETVLACDGVEALEIFRADPGRFSLVLLDLTMPRMDGEQTFREMRLVRADLPVVLMSGFSKQEALARFAGKGLASFVQKPFAFEPLQAVVKEVLG
jgi:DNA-binding NtrC family response regulator